MASKFLVPLEVPNYLGTPADKADAGFALLYIKHGWVTRQETGAIETDLVLARPLDGFSLPLTATPVTSTDTVKSALEKLQQSLLSVTLSGDVTGTAAYNAGVLEIVTTYTGNTAPSVATAFDTNHYAGIVNPYIAGDIVYKDGHIFQALFTNDAIPPTIGGNIYWQDLGLGNVLRQTPVDWNATEGDYQILNKPNIPTLTSDLTNDSGFITTESDTLDAVTTRGNTTLNTITVGGITATGVTSTIYAGTGTRLRTEANHVVFERESSSGFMKFYINQTTLSPTAKSYMGYNNATLNVVLSNEYATGSLELRTQDIIRQQIFANGNVVIGSSAPVDANYKLDVLGVVRTQDIRTGAHSFRDQMHISHTADGWTKQAIYNAAGAHALTFIGDLRFASSAAIKAVFAFNGTYSNNGTIHTGESSLMKIFTGDAFGNTVGSTNLNNYGVNLMPTLNYTTGTSTFTGFYYNPTVTSTTGLTHYAIDLVTGLVRFRDLSGTGTRMVVADASGVLSTQTIPSGFTLPALTAGSVLFSDGTTIAQDNANLFWDDVNNRLGINTATPAYGVDIAGAAGAASSIRTGWGVYSRYLINPTATGTYIEFQPSVHQMQFTINGTEAIRIPSTRNVLIGTTTDAGFKLDVNGTARVTGSSLFQGTALFTNSTFGSAIQINNVSGNAFSLAIYSNAASDTNFQTQGNFNGNNFRITAAGFAMGRGGLPTLDASALLNINSTTQGFLPPRMTTTQKNAIATPAPGLVVYDNTDNKHYGFDGSTWYSFQTDYSILGLQNALSTDSALTSDNSIDGTGLNIDWTFRKTSWNGDGRFDIMMDDGSNQYAQLKVDIFGGGPGSVVMRTYDYTSGNFTSVETYAAALLIKTLQVSTKAAGDVLTLVDPLTGEVEYNTPSTGGVTASESIINALIFG